MEEKVCIAAQSSPQGAPLPCDGRLVRIETMLEQLVNNRKDQEDRVRVLEDLTRELPKRGRWSVMNFIGNATGILAFATLVFYGGSFTSSTTEKITHLDTRLGERAQGLDNRLKDLETFGARPMRESIGRIESELKSVDARVTKVELGTQDVPTEIARLSQKVDSLIDWVKKGSFGP